jgi:hypothetical protein
MRSYRGGCLRTLQELGHVWNLKLNLPNEITVPTQPVAFLRREGLPLLFMSYTFLLGLTYSSLFEPMIFVLGLETTD